MLHTNPFGSPKFLRGCLDKQLHDPNPHSKWADSAIRVCFSLGTGTHRAKYRLPGKKIRT